MQASRDEIVRTTRGTIGAVGALIGAADKNGTIPWERRLDGILRMEQAGYRAAWTGEGVGGKDAFIEMALMLGATQRMAVGAATASVWARPAVTANAAARMLASAYPGRFLFALAIGYPAQAERVGRHYERPAQTVEGYLADMATECPEKGLPDCPRMVGANGPKMLDVAARCSDGAVPSVVPPAYVRYAREVLGPDKLLAVAVPLVGEPDKEITQNIASGIVKGIAGFPGSPYGANLLRLGYTEADLAGPSDRLRDEVVAYGAGEDVATAVARYLDAGADHVVLTPMTPDHDTAVDWLEKVAPAVLGLSRLISS